MNPINRSMKGTTVNALKRKRLQLQRDLKRISNGIYLVKARGDDKTPAVFERTPNDYRQQIRILNQIIKKRQENYHARSKQYFDERYHMFLLQKTAREQAGLKGIL